MNDESAPIFDRVYQQIVKARAAGCNCPVGQRNGNCLVHGHDIRNGAWAVPQWPGRGLTKAQRELLGLADAFGCTCHGMEQAWS